MKLTFDLDPPGVVEAVVGATRDRRRPGRRVRDKAVPEPGGNEFTPVVAREGDLVVCPFVEGVVAPRGSDDDVLRAGVSAGRARKNRGTSPARG